MMAVNQHSSHNKQLKEENGLVVWTAEVPGTEDKYVAFFNTNDAGDSNMSVSLRELGLSGSYTSKDLWNDDKVQNPFTDQFTMSVKPMPPY